MTGGLHSSIHEYYDIMILTGKPNKSNHHRDIKIEALGPRVSSNEILFYFFIAIDCDVYTPCMSVTF